MNEARLADCVKLLRMKLHWGNLPTRMRLFYLAQRAICPYCGEKMQTVHFNMRAHRNRQIAVMILTYDHVIPKARGGTNANSNLVLAHAGCNERKRDRAPYPCEILFCQITAECIEAIKATF